MKILSIYRHYWPDTAPFGRILKLILERWVNDGHIVTVYSGQPSYNDIYIEKRPWYEVHNGVNIIRVFLLPEKKKICWLRFVNFLIFLSRSLFHVLINRYDLIIINSYPPILMGFTARLINRVRRIPYIYYCQDIQPESSILAGYLKNGYLYNFIKKIDTNNCKRASVVVTLSEDMANTLSDRGLLREKIWVRNNFIIDTYNAQNDLLPDIFKTTEDNFRVLFAGNIGNFQGLENVVEAAKLLYDNSKIKFIFMGEGEAKVNLIKQAGELLDKTVFFIPYKPIEIAFAAMSNSDLGVVPLKPGLFKMAFPSKTMMYLAAGCPVLTIVENESELSRFTKEKGVGCSCPLEPLSIAQTISSAYELRKELKMKRDEIRKVGNKEFGKDIALNEWSRLIQKSKLC